MGDMDLVRPLGLAGVRCAVVVPPGAASRYSRFTEQSLPWADSWKQPDALVESLIEFAKTQTERPVLFYQTDGELLLVSRNRERLHKYFRFTVADPELVEALVDKERFQKLAERLNLPVPRARRLKPADEFETFDLHYPVVVKPLTRRPETWKTLVPSGKALRVNSADEMRKLWTRLTSSTIELLAQELVPGPETKIESYHVYVDAQGSIRGEFTGRKIRTYPLEYGDSTALLTTSEADVTALGRELVQRLSLRGVAKFDFKRSPDGRLYLLEVNPRFNLWHHLGALAGVNLPALVYRDLLGEAPPSITQAKPGLCWTRVWQDALAAHKSEVRLAQWAKWTMRAEAKRLLAWDDPMPFIGGVLWRVKHSAGSWLKNTSTSNTSPEDRQPRVIAETTGRDLEFNKG
jgi:D-aspartate ligase